MSRKRREGNLDILIESKFCGGRRSRMTMTQKDTKASALYTIFLSRELLTFFVNGKKLGSIIIPGHVKDAACIENIKHLTSTNRGFIVLSMSYKVFQFRALPSSRLPDVSKVTPAPTSSPPNIIYETETIPKPPVIKDEEKEDKKDHIVNEDKIPGNNQVHIIPDSGKEKDGGVNPGSGSGSKHHHYIIKDKTGAEINVTFPSIGTTFEDNGDGSLVVYFDHDEPFKGISSFQLIVQHDDKYRSPSWDPLSYKETLYEWEDAERIYMETREAVPFVAAEVSALGETFVLGDEKTYGGYFNGKLVNGKKYTLRVRGIVELSDENAFFDTGVVGTFSSHWATFLSVGTGVTILVVVIGYVTFTYVREGRKKREVKETIAEFTNLLEDNDPAAHHDTSSEEGANHVISPLLSPTHDSDTWWELSDSAEDPTDPAAAASQHYFSLPQHNRDPLQSSAEPREGAHHTHPDHDTAEVAVVEEVTHLVTNRHKESLVPSKLLSRTDLLVSNHEMELPDENVREDEIYHF